MNSCQTVYVKGQGYNTLDSVCNLENNCLTAF